MRCAVLRGAAREPVSQCISMETFTRAPSAAQCRLPSTCERALKTIIAGYDDAATYPARIDDVISDVFRRLVSKQKPVAWS